jgi:DNA primase
MDFGDRRKESNREYYSAEQVKRVLQSCGINIELEIDSDYIIYCPFHSNFRTPAAEVSKTTGYLYCFGCQQSKTFVELVMHCTKRSFFESMRLIDSKRVETSILSEINATISKPAEFIEFDSAMIDNLHNNLRENAEARNYLINRGITIESMQRYKIGYSLKRIMITIPIHAPDGMCVGFVGRSIEGKEFSNSHGLPRSKTLFNIHRTKISSQIFVVESSFDAMRIEQVGRAAVATLGSTVSNKQMSLLKQYFNSIILLPDNDEAGRSMTKKMQESLGNSVVIGNIPKEYKDISDMNDSELTSLIYRFDNMVEYIFN